MRDWVEERMLRALETHVPVYRYNFARRLYEEVRLPVTLAYHMGAASAWGFTYLHLPRSTRIFTLFWWYNDVYPHPRIAVSRWLYDLYAWYYRRNLY